MKRTSIGLLIVSLAISIIGLVDSAGDTQWDHFALFTVVALLQSGVLLLARGRATISLRPDLARWAQQRAQRTGEPVDDVADRAVAWYRHGLYQPDSANVD